MNWLTVSSNYFYRQLIEKLHMYNVNVISTYLDCLAINMLQLFTGCARLRNELWVDHQILNEKSRLNTFTA